MSAIAAADTREISELLHYTTSPGVLGVLAARRLLSRKRLENNEEIAFIRDPVWPSRLAAWEDHISLSISRINSELHSQSRYRHTEHWWAILSFSTEILDDDNVWFATCNNLFPSCQRSQSAEGFEKLFANEVEGKYQVKKTRVTPMSPSWPTDRTAEVLYPGEIFLTHLRCIYVAEAEHRAQIIAWLEMFPIDDIEIIVEPDRFS